MRNIEKTETDREKLARINPKNLLKILLANEEDKGKGY